MSRPRGFTLIELMIVIAIIAILSAFAVPAYSRYGYRARRADGQELLLRFAAAQERYYATFNKYGSLTEIGFVEPFLSEKGFYALSLSPATPASAFTAAAAPQGAQQSDVCGTLKMDGTGVKTSDASKNISSNGNCW